MRRDRAAWQAVVRTKTERPKETSRQSSTAKQTDGRVPSAVWAGTLGGGDEPPRVGQSTVVDGRSRSSAQASQCANTQRQGTRRERRTTVPVVRVGRRSSLPPGRGRCGQPRAGIPRREIYLVRVHLALGRMPRHSNPHARSLKQRQIT